MDLVADYVVFLAVLCNALTFHWWPVGRKSWAMAWPTILEPVSVTWCFKFKFTKKKMAQTQPSAWWVSKTIRFIEILLTYVLRAAFHLLFLYIHRLTVIFGLSNSDAAFLNGHAPLRAQTRFFTGTQSPVHVRATYICVVVSKSNCSFRDPRYISSPYWYSVGCGLMLSVLYKQDTPPHFS